MLAIRSWGGEGHGNGKRESRALAELSHPLDVTSNVLDHWGQASGVWLLLSLE